MERCIFCGWNRRTAFPSVRFFTIPREPGLKQMMWMKAIDKKCEAEGGRYEQCSRDRVCSVHFRSTRPSSDVRHEDFAPHLYLTSEPPAEVLNYLEKLAEPKVEPPRIVVKNEAVHGEYKAHVNTMHPNRIEVSKISRPSILQRKRKQPPLAEDEQQQQVDTEGEEEEEGDSPVAPHSLAASHSDYRLAPNAQQSEDQPGLRRLRLQHINRSVIDVLGARPGQVVIIKRRVRKGNLHPSSVMGGE